MSRRIDNTEFVRGRRNLDGPWFIQPPEPASQPASQPANQARLDTSTMLRFSRLPLTLSSSFHPVYYLCPILVAGTPFPPIYIYIYIYIYILSRSSSHSAICEHTYMPSTGFPIVLVAPAHERGLPPAFAAEGKRCKSSIASPLGSEIPLAAIVTWMTHQVSPGVFVPSSAALLARIRNRRCYFATSELFPLANVLATLRVALGWKIYLAFG